MEFTLPTTKEEMYEVLEQLFNHYRVRKEGFEEVSLEELALERLNIDFETDSELMTKAQELLKAEHEREIKEYQLNLTSKIKEMQEKITLIEENSEEEIAKITTLYSESIAKVQNQALKAGVASSTIVIDKTALLEDSKNQKIALLTQEKNDKVANLLAEIEKLNLLLSNSQEYFSLVHQKEIEKKFIELSDNREEKKIEIFKYNNGLDEKEQRYSNSIKQTKSSLHLRFLDIKAAEYTKDQLVEMGYFKDVINCVCAYFDTLEPLYAYQAFLSEKQLMVFLDFYYEQVALLYKYKAGI